MIHTFSPNWYKPQCLLFHKNTLFYASNYVLYKYNLDSRRVEADKCFRKIALKTGMDAKDIKIHTIVQINEKWLLVNTNQPHAVLLEIEGFGVVNVFRNIGVQSTFFCWAGFDQKRGLAFAIFAGEDGGLSKLTLESSQEYKITTLSSPQLPKQKPKQILSKCNMSMIVYSKGQIVFFDQYFDKVVQEVPAAAIGLDQQFVLSLDHWADGPVLWAAMLTRTKSNGVFLHFWSCLAGENGVGEVKFKSVLKSEIKIQYPKLMMDKLKNAQKAAMTIKLFSPTHLLLSGKLGQLFILDLQICPQQIPIKPQSLDELPPYLQILNDSKHYKQIYSIYTHSRAKQDKLITQLYTVSTDQTMGVWTVGESGKGLAFGYNVKFITAELQSIFYGEGDPKTVFFLLRDSNIRSMVPFGGQNYFLNEYWKFTKKFRILKAVAHLEQPGITAMVTQCGQIILYDLYDDRLMKIHDLKIKNPNEQIINLTFEYRSIIPAIQLTTSTIEPSSQKWQTEQLKTNRYYTKTIKNNSEIGLLIQQKNRLLYICERDKENQDAFSIRRVCRIQRVHNTKLWDRNTMLFSQCKGNVLRVWLYAKGVVGKLETGLKMGGRCIFKLDYPVLRVLEYKGKKVQIHAFSLETDFQKLSQLQIDIPVFSEQVVLDYNSNQAIFYNGKDDLLAYIDFTTNEPKVLCLETGNKVESLAFYFSQHIVVGFKDQSIKVLKLADMEYVKEQPQKKVKKTMESQPEPEPMEQEEKEPKMMMSLQE